MGGTGSGRRPSYGGKTETHKATPLDIRKLARAGLLAPGRVFAWEWTDSNRVVASISVRSEPKGLVLSYQRRSKGVDITQRVSTQTTPCRLGGHRHWFTCPHCFRRVAILYAPGGKYFSCRHCYRLGYASQKEGFGDRAARQANKIRRRLGWPVGILNDTGGKPKGMHWKTFWRLQAEHDTLSQACFHDIGRKLGFLHRLLEK